MSLFKPLIYQKNIFSINYKKLKERKIELLIFDLDNTILKVGDDLPSIETQELFKKLEKDFKIIIASNNVRKKVSKIADFLNCDYLYSLMKPSKRIKRFLDKKYNIDSSKCAIIGDQIVTDIIVGNRLGMCTILIDPMSERDYKVTFLNRWFEKKIMKKIKLKKGEYYEG